MRAAPSTTRTRRTMAVVLAIATLGATACSDDLVVDGSGSSDSIAQQLAGTTQLSTTVDGQSLADGTRLVISFEDSTVALVAGCNILFGGFTIDDGRLVGEQLAQTLMACDGDLALQDEWVAEFLESSPAISLDDDELTLSDGSITITFQDRELIANAHPFDGSLWAIASLDGPDGSLAAPELAHVAVYDGQIHLATGCNTGFAGIEVGADQTVTIDPIALTMRLCEDAVMTWETALITFLNGTLTYTIDDELVLSDGETSLRLIAIT